MTRLTKFERDKFEEINDEIVIDVVIVDGVEMPIDPRVRTTTLEKDKFTDVGGKTAVRVNIVGGSAGGSCTIETTLETTSFGWDASGSPNRNFNVDNTGFQWDLALGSTNIIALCENTLVTPLPTTTAGMGALSVGSITLDGTDITSSVTVDTSTADTIKLNYNTQIVNPDLMTNNSFEVKLNLLLGTTTVPEITRTLTYNAPIHNVSITRDNVDFNGTYTTANILRSNPNGAPTSITSTVFGGVTQTAGALSITFTALNRLANATARGLVEIALFTNATNSSQTISLTTNTTLNVTFFFPVYLGNVTVAEASALSTSLLNTVSRFSRIGTFTNIPSSQTYTWPTNTVAAQTDRIFAIKSSFTNGANITVRSAPGTFPSIISRNSILALGTISGNTENYDIYIVQVSAPGAGSLFIEV